MLFKHYTKIRHIDDTIHIMIVNRWLIFEFFVMEVGSVHDLGGGAYFEVLLDKAEKICKRLNKIQ